MRALCSPFMLNMHTTRCSVNPVNFQVAPKADAGLNRIREVQEESKGLLKLARIMRFYDRGGTRLYGGGSLVPGAKFSENEGVTGKESTRRQKARVAPGSGSQNLFFFPSFLRGLAQVQVGVTTAYRKVSSCRTFLIFILSWNMRLLCYRNIFCL